MIINIKSEHGGSDSSSPNGIKEHRPVVRGHEHGYEEHESEEGRNWALVLTFLSVPAAAITALVVLVF